MATLRVYAATVWNTVLEVHDVTERPAPRASGREHDVWADVTVDNNGGEPHRVEVRISPSGFAAVLEPDEDLTTPRFVNLPLRYVTDDQVVAHFKRAMLA